MAREMTNISQVAYGNLSLSFFHLTKVVQNKIVRRKLWCQFLTASDKLAEIHLLPFFYLLGQL